MTPSITFPLSTTGELRAPHAPFWSALPGLVSDGIQFSMCRCFGYAGSSGRSYERIEPAGSSYGAL
jgi:hypothetical protein